ncbi:MAG: hydroxymethylbilane synthase [Nocardioidaceae bacterium]|nr:hydroxymethylbilane synthase [Nocardioidaceae bacterium]
MTTLRIGTRASTLARTQSQIVADSLAQVLEVTVELVAVVSEGDRSSAPLTEIGGQGVFVGAVREALVAGDVDIVVHSLKDLPTAPDERVRLAAVPARDDSRDALVARDGLTLGELPVGSTVGTGSPRRAAQLNALGLGLDVVPIRGNVDTRIAKVAAGELDAVLLARAGLVRLGRQDEITETIDPIQMLPAPGQGALAIEVAASAGSLAGDISAALDDPFSRAAVTAERALLRTLEAGCLAPVGALAYVAEGDDGPELWLRGVVVALDGSRAVRQSAVGSTADPTEVGDRLAKEMLAEGADSIMQERSS